MTTAKDAARHLCAQWAAVGFIILNKECLVPQQKFQQMVRSVINNSAYPELKEELGVVIDKYDMELNDIHLYLNCIEGLINQVVNDNTFITIYENIITYFYDSVSVAIRIIDSENFSQKERTSTQPQFQIPNQAFEFIEKRLSYVYYLVKGQDFHLYKDISTSTAPYLFDFLLHSPMRIDKRYEGSILSILTFDSKWNKLVSDRINELYSSIKKSECKKALLLLAKNVKHLRHDFSVKANQSSIINSCCEWANFAMKITDDETQWTLVDFTVRTMRALKWGTTYQQDTSTREVIKKLIELAFKIFKSNKYEADFLDLVSRTTSLLNVSTFDSYWKKLWGAVEDHFKKQLSRRSFESLTLFMHIFCPEFINGEQLNRFTMEILYERSKSFNFAKHFNDYVPCIRDYYISFAKVEPNIVSNYLLNLSKHALSEIGPKTQYMMEILAPILDIKNVKAKELLSAIEQKLEVFIRDSNLSIVRSTIMTLPHFWIHIPRTRPQVSMCFQILTSEANPDIVLECVTAFIELMKRASAADFPLTEAYKIPVPLIKRFTSTISAEDYRKLIMMMSEYVLSLINIFKQKSVDNYSEWEDLNRIFDTMLFPFLFHPEATIRHSARSFFGDVSTFNNFPCTASWLAENKGRPLISSLKNAVEMRPEWFNEICSSASQFWQGINQASHKSFAISLAEAICTMIRPDGKFNWTPFIEKLLNLFASIEVKQMEQILSKLVPQAWPVFFNEFNKYYEKHIGDNPTLCWNIQMVFLTKRAFPKFTTHRSTYSSTLKTFIKSKRARFERDIPAEIVQLNICSSIIRVDPEALQSLIDDIGIKGLYHNLMERISPKEIFVVNISRLYAHLDLFEAVLELSWCPSTEVTEIISYLLSIADKAMDFPEIQSLVASCIDKLYVRNKDSRMLIIETALAFKNTLLNEIGSAILMSMQGEEAVTDRNELTSILLLGTSLLSSVMNSSHAIGIKLLHRALSVLAQGDETISKVFSNPLLQYDPSAESYMWKLISIYLSDEEFEKFSDLLAKVVDNVPRRLDPPYFVIKALGVFKGGSLDDFDVLFQFLAASSFEDFLRITPILEAADRMFTAGNASINDVLNLMYEKAKLGGDALTSAVYIVQRAFAAHPDETIAFLKQHLSFINADDFYPLVNSPTDELKIVYYMLSFILAMNNSIDLTHRLFGDIIVNLLIFALHAFETTSFKHRLFPPLLLSLLHSMSDTIQIAQFSDDGNELSPSQFQWIHAALIAFDSVRAEEFRHMIIPTKDSQILHLNFTYAIAQTFDAHAISTLLGVVAKYATKDNVGVMLKFLPFLCNALPDVAPPITIAYFVLCLISFMFDNADTRLIVAVSHELPLLTRRLEAKGSKLDVGTELSKLIAAAGGDSMIIAVLLEPLVLADSVAGTLYQAVMGFASSLVALISSDDSKLSVIDEVVIILDALLTLSGHRGMMYRARKTGWANGCPGIDELVKFLQATTAEANHKILTTFLLELTSKNVIQDQRFRMNMTNLFCNYVNNIDSIASIVGVGEFLLVSSVCSDQSVSQRYAQLLGQLITREKGITREATAFVNVLGPLLLVNDPDSLVEIRTISPAFYPEHPLEVRPPRLEEFISELDLK